MRDSAVFPTSFYARRRRIAEVLATVEDPEIPNLSIVDLGMVIDIRETRGTWAVDLAPTYSGCPAIDVIPLMVHSRLEESGLSGIDIQTVLTPAWSTDWISETGLEKLDACGIAPPSGKTGASADEGKPRRCPHCGGEHLILVSRHGSTPCKAAYKCATCLEPFEYFKCF